MKTFGYDYSSSQNLSSLEYYTVNWVNGTDIGQHK